MFYVHDCQLQTSHEHSDNKQRICISIFSSEGSQVFIIKCLSAQNLRPCVEVAAFMAKYIFKRLAIF